MQLLFGILFIGLILFAVGGVAYFFILEEVQTRNYIKWLNKLEDMKEDDLCQ